MKTKKAKLQKTMHELFRVNVAGVQYGEYQNHYVKDYIKHGSKLQLYWERANKIDPNAIKICYHGRKIGYIPRDGKEQTMLHDYRKMGIKIDCEVVSVNPNNPSWHHFVVKCSSIRAATTTNEDVSF